MSLRLKDKESFFLFEPATLWFLTVQLLIEHSGTKTPVGCSTQILIHYPNHSTHTHTLAKLAADVNHNKGGRVVEMRKRAGKQVELDISIGPFIRGSGTLINMSPWS